MNALGVWGANSSHTEAIEAARCVSSGIALPSVGDLKGGYDLRFEGKVVAITGGGQGIGLAFAHALAQEGSGVAIYDIDAARANAAVQVLKHAGAKALAARCDVADEAQVDAAVTATIEQLGGVDILINGAAKHLMEYNAPCLTLPRDKVAFDARRQRHRHRQLRGGGPRQYA
jgi:hypothetical protein